jgi:hypothetical protein
MRCAGLVEGWGTSGTRHLLLLALVAGASLASVARIAQSLALDPSGFLVAAVIWAMVLLGIGFAYSRYARGWGRSVEAFIATEQARTPGTVVTTGLLNDDGVLTLKAEVNSAPVPTRNQFGGAYVVLVASSTELAFWLAPALGRSTPALLATFDWSRIASFETARVGTGLRTDDGLVIRLRDGRSLGVVVLAFDGRWRAAIDPHPAVDDLNVVLAGAARASGPSSDSSLASPTP